MPTNYKYRFVTQAARLAYTVTAHDLGFLVYDLSDGRSYRAIQEGSGASVWEAEESMFTGPSSSTDNAIARWDGTGGETMQDSSASVNDTGAVFPANAAATPAAQTDVGLRAGTAAPNDSGGDDGDHYSRSTGQRYYKNTSSAWERAAGEAFNYVTATGTTAITAPEWATHARVTCRPASGGGGGGASGAGGSSSAEGVGGAGGYAGESMVPSVVVIPVTGGASYDAIVGAGGAGGAGGTAAAADAGGAAEVTGVVGSDGGASQFKVTGGSVLAGWGGGLGGRAGATRNTWDSIYLHSGAMPLLGGGLPGAGGTAGNAGSNAQTYDTLSNATGTYLGTGSVTRNGTTSTGGTSGASTGGGGGGGAPAVHGPGAPNDVDTPVGDGGAGGAASTAGTAGDTPSASSNGAGGSGGGGGGGGGIDASGTQGGDGGTGGAGCDATMLIEWLG